MNFFPEPDVSDTKCSMNGPCVLQLCRGATPSVVRWVQAKALCIGPSVPDTSLGCVPAFGCGSILSA